jgi:hypothetical protein
LIWAVDLDRPSGRQWADWPRGLAVKIGQDNGWPAGPTFCSSRSVVRRQVSRMTAMRSVVRSVVRQPAQAGDKGRNSGLPARATGPDPIESDQDPMSFQDPMSLWMISRQALRACPERKPVPALRKRDPAGRIMLSQPKSTMTLSRGALYCFGGGFGRIPQWMQCCIRGRFPVQRIKLALPKPEPMQPREYGAAPLPGGSR